MLTLIDLNKASHKKPLLMCKCVYENLPRAQKCRSDRLIHLREIVMAALHPAMLISLS